MTDVAVHFSNVSKHYPHFLLDRVNLTLATGTIMGFIGANGAGKSTTLRILMGLVHQDQGDVQVLGQPMPARQVATKYDIGFVSDDMRLYGAATIGWHMEFIRSIYPTWDQGFAERLLKRFDLMAQHKIKGLSHGQRVKATLLLALARHPRLLVLDEPTTGLDPIARHEVLGALMDVLADAGRTVLFSSHNTLDIEQVADYITFIDQGRIINSDDKETYLDRWRRLRVEVSPGTHVPKLPGIVGIGGSERLMVLTTNCYDPSMEAVYTQAGLTVHAVESMTLEEIFLASVQSRREGQTV
ncbi:ABC transporter ATP-binding protein [Herpetosiphon gulosus]|uniref:ABC transporter ATP-binding protein YtrB n=1 Tax=Herpetosiphon gulosus TaxID=1973496 RepID=A0ABP9XAH7_9CHLR